jgi:HAD superfamily hydrolase (TIGR01509 family)
MLYGNLQASDKIAPMKKQALIFDFDGLILDTESPEFDVWQAIYREYGQELAAETWGQIVGGWAASDFDAAEHLVKLAGNGLKPEALRQRHQSESDAIVRQQPLMPGVLDYLDQARRLGLRLSIASSSPHSWVDPHLSRFALTQRFDAIICRDEVHPGRTKPHPDLFLKALAALGVRADEAIVFEDSPNGVAAARAADIFVVAVPNPMTALLDLDGANLKLNSLADLSLVDLLNKTL